MQNQSRKPNILVGSEQLSAAVYKTYDESVGFKYRFNIVRLNQQSGRVSHWFSPGDISPMLNLLRVLTSELINDGCLEKKQRKKLRKIVLKLEQLFDEITPKDTSK